jgi:hypothetical protein
MRALVSQARALMITISQALCLRTRRDGRSRTGEYPAAVVAGFPRRVLRDEQAKSEQGTTQT